MTLCAAAVALAACQTPEHTNTLIFGTNTKIALDVSVNPAGGTPDITLGYKRQEAVWMPLLANQGPPDNRKPASCALGGTEGAAEGAADGAAEGAADTNGGTATSESEVTNTDNCLFFSSDTNGNKQDTYSVLASLGAEFGSEARTSTDGVPDASAAASGGLAQFFATGIAAQKLAEAGAQLVSVRSPTEEALENAQRRAEAAENRLIEFSKVRGPESVSDSFLSRKDKVIANIVRLDDMKAIELASNLPAANEEVMAFMNAIDPQQLRKSNGMHARDVLVKGFEVGVQTVDDLEKWERAVQQE